MKPEDKARIVVDLTQEKGPFYYRNANDYYNIYKSTYSRNAMGWIGNAVRPFTILPLNDRAPDDAPLKSWQQAWFPRVMFQDDVDNRQSAEESALKVGLKFV